MCGISITKIKTNMRHAFFEIAELEDCKVSFFADDYVDEFTGIKKTHCEFRKDYHEGLPRTLVIPVKHFTQTNNFRRADPLTDETVYLTKRDALELYVHHQKMIVDAVRPLVEEAYAE